MIKIRKYQKKDKNKTKELIVEVFKEFFNKNIIKKWENFEDYSIFYVAEEGNKIIACAALHDDGKGIIKLKRMYMLKEYRGKGIAQKIFDKLLNFAIKSKFNCVRLSTVPEMERAISFYRKNGFVELKNVNIKKEFPELKNESVKDLVFMERKLR